MDIFQILASVSSIISIPLAIHYAHKSNNATSEKARIDIIQTLSYRLRDTHKLTYDDIDSVYKSKLREYEITHVKFTKEDILNDLKTNVMSNAFLKNSIKNDILYNLSIVSFPKKEILCHPINRLFIPLIRVFISPAPCVLLITNIIICILLLCPYVFKIFISSMIYTLNASFLDNLCEELYNDIILHISLADLLTLSIICIFRKRYLKNNWF